MIAAALNWEDFASSLTGIVGIVIALLIFALTVLVDYDLVKSC